MHKHIKETRTGTYIHTHTRVYNVGMLEWLRGTERSRKSAREASATYTKRVRARESSREKKYEQTVRRAQKEADKIHTEIDRYREGMCERECVRVVWVCWGCDYVKLSHC